MEDLVGFVSKARWVGHPTVVFSTLSSTQDEARRHAEGGCAQGLWVLADTQTAGRGRRGRPWLSPPEGNLYLSLVLRPEMALSRVPVLALVAGLAVRDALAQFVGTEDVLVKWPNDVRVRGKKLSGVLVDGVTRGAALSYALVGVGVNVRGETLPEELRSIATTLRVCSGRDISRPRVLAALSESLEQRFDELAREGFGPARRALKVCCETLGQRVSIEGLQGVAEDLAEDGALRLRCDDGELVECRSGDVG